MLCKEAFRFRIFPTHEQAVLISKTLGCSRFVFNRFLARWNETYKQTGKGLTYHSCSAQLPPLKKEFPWLQEVDSTAIQSSLQNLADGFIRFLKKQNEAPRFKSKKNQVHSYTTIHTNGNIRINRNQIRLPKLGWVKFAKSREVEGRILNVTVRRIQLGNILFRCFVKSLTLRMFKWIKRKALASTSVSKILLQFPRGKRSAILSTFACMKRN